MPMNLMPRVFYKGGASSGSNKTDPMNVPFDEWGKEIDLQSEGEGEEQAWIEDRLRWIEEEDLVDATKKDVLNAILSYRDDDGLWTDDDMSGYIAYKDGRFIDVKDLNGKSFPRQGIIGAYFSDAGQEAAWGNEIHFKNGRAYEVPITVRTEDDRELANTYRSYTSTGMYRVRTRTTYPLNKYGRRETHVETIRKSTVKPTGHKVHRK